MVLCAARVFIVTITMITPLQEAFRAIFFANGLAICWTKHGEKGVIMEDNEEEDFDDHFLENA